MITITGYRLAKGKDDKDFAVLQIEGDPEMCQSLQNGRFYLTARRCSITSTFNEEAAKALIGTKMPGVIKRVESEPYDYVIQGTGEVIKLAHTYEYFPEGKQAQETPSLPHPSLGRTDFMLRNKQLV